MFRTLLPLHSSIRKFPFEYTKKSTSINQIIRSISIQTETTPNENALKFKSSRKLLPDNQTIEILSKKQSIGQPLASDLFQVDGVKGIMIGSDFITIEKYKLENWSDLKPEIFMILTEFISSNNKILTLPEQEKQTNKNLDEDEEEIIEMIEELIETRIRPTIQEDGGDLSFEKFDTITGTVYLKLKGACRSCESSSLTLKTGIESMLMHYIEEVQSVEQIDEEEDLVEDIIMKGKAAKEINISSSS